MTDQSLPRKPRTRHGLSTRELRSSILLPTLIGLGILLIGSVIAIFVAPESVMAALSIVVGIALAAYLLYYGRNASWRLRVTAVIMALPAVLGITLGMVQGRFAFFLLGVGLTVLLLVLLRVLSVPISYRAAYRRFREGRNPEALDLINRSIEARPDFWESYQLRALLHLMNLDFPRAERDARKAVELKPNAHPAYNTLGQIYLAEERFDKAQETFAAALEQAPDLSLFSFHYGLACYRLSAYRTAADAFDAATAGTLPIIEYDLQGYYYWMKSLEALGEPEQATAVAHEMRKFAVAYDDLREQLNQQPDYPHVATLRADLADMAGYLFNDDSQNA